MYSCLDQGANIIVLYNLNS